jgi:hypothetical protein
MLIRKFHLKEQLNNKNKSERSRENYGQERS